MKKTKKSPLVLAIEIMLLLALLAALAYIIMLSLDANRGLGQTDADIIKPKKVTATAEPTPTPTPVGLADFNPHSVEGTEPENLIEKTEIMVDGELVDDYEAQYEIYFDLAEKYTELEGVLGFRGDNFRSGAAYGTAEVTNKTLSTVWTHSTTSLNDVDGYSWSGSGWTGQPIIVKWPAETRKNMTAMYEWAREKNELVEVIYATLDGHIYFYELTTGEATRDALNVGYTFKGAGALDPRGYPILYLGAGVDSTLGTGRAFVINLIDNSIMFEFGNNDGFAYRDWSMFDSSPLVSAETDQLIYPGENGVLYIIHLNTTYNEQTGELSVDPDNIVKWKYDSTRNGSQYWLGIESSAAIINNYIYLADNGGNLMCLDLNTLELVWVQDVLDDTNTSPVVSVEDGKAYVYISTSFHYGWRSSYQAVIPIWKIDAETGEIVWQTDYECYTVADISGGVQGTIAVGKNELSDMIFVPVARTPSAGAGVLVALDKKTGEKVWERETGTYSWSSPVDFYDADGNGYLAYCTFVGSLCLIDGQTGEIVNYIDIGKAEASPAMYNGYIVVGTRTMKIQCVKVG